MKKIEYPVSLNGEPYEGNGNEVCFGEKWAELAYQQASEDDEYEFGLYRSPDGQLFFDAPTGWWLVDPSEIQDGDYERFVVDYTTEFLASDR